MNVAELISHLTRFPRTARVMTKGRQTLYPIEVLPHMVITKPKTDWGCPPEGAVEIDVYAPNGNDLV